MQIISDNMCYAEFSPENIFQDIINDFIKSANILRGFEESQLLMYVYEDDKIKIYEYCDMNCVCEFFLDEIGFRSIEIDFISYHSPLFGVVLLEKLICIYRYIGRMYAEF